MSGTADLKKNTVLALERDLPIVQAARGVHDPECADQCVRIQTLEVQPPWAFRAGWRGRYPGVLLTQV